MLILQKENSPLRPLQQYPGVVDYKAIRYAHSSKPVAIAPSISARNAPVGHISYFGGVQYAEALIRIYIIGIFFADFLQSAQHRHSHAIKLIKVLRKYTQETYSLQERCICICRFLHYAFVKS